MSLKDQWQNKRFWTKKRSSVIRKQLSIFNINDKLTQYKINWRENTQRMDDKKNPKKFELQT
jgi:hypothetical protein